ncbi:DsbA family protein [Archaeoglobus neptunius]|uniref:DsbA family protein n=1 Tax=Archaeoglobus neptunius TaxID=2798580 RepID=UPI001E516584|nr:DsbA family protein [Archaeoglobus neptunius]
MRDLVIGIVLGIIVGAIAVYAVTSMAPSGEEFCSANTQVLDQKTIESVTAKLNNIVHKNNPDVNVRISDYKPYGELYLVNIEFYNEKGVIEHYKMYLTANGSLLFTNPINLTRVSEKPQEEQRINVSVDDDPYRGAKNAKVVIVEFSDYACPYCAKFATEVEPKILENFGDKVKIVFRDFPIHGNTSYFAAEAANCAGEQGKYWEFHDLLFKNQREWMSNHSKIYDYAKQLGLNVSAFRACVESGKYREEISKDYKDGVSYGVTGTPTFFINGKKYVGYKPYEEFAKLIEQELQKTS